MAALAAHAAVLAWLAMEPTLSVPENDSTAVPVRLVAAPAEPVPPKEPTPAPPLQGLKPPAPAEAIPPEKPTLAPPPQALDEPPPAEAIPPDAPTPARPLDALTESPAEPIAPKAPEAPPSNGVNGLSEIAGPPPEKPKRLGQAASHRAAAHPAHAQQKPEHAASPPADTANGAQELPPATAVYQVSVGSGGVVQSIALAQSSGVSSFDAAGINMIRSSMTFNPPAPGSASAIMIVTINFSADAP